MWEWKVRGASPPRFIKENNEYQQIEFKQFDPLYWAGIDCSALVTRTVQAGLEKMKDGTEYFIKLAPVSNGSSLIEFHQDAAVANWGSDTFFRRTVNTAKGEKLMVHYLSDKSAKTVSKLHRGDLIDYPNHISLVYSEDRPACSATTDSKTRKKVENCSYEIIHAYGGDSYKKIINGVEKRVYSRKVLISPNDISTTINNPTGFGRIKLWD
jgi:hypothetical protein